MKLFEQKTLDVNNKIDYQIHNNFDHLRQAKGIDEASKRIKHLEGKIKQLESRIPKQFPNVKFLNYRERKRILVNKD